MAEVFLWGALRLRGVHPSQKQEPAPSCTCLLLQFSLLQAVSQLQLQSHKPYKIMTSDFFLKVQFLNEALLSERVIFSPMWLRAKVLKRNHGWKTSKYPSWACGFWTKEVSALHVWRIQFTCYFFQPLCCHSKRRQSPIEQCKHPTTSITKYVLVWVPKKKCQVRMKSPITVLHTQGLSGFKQHPLLP